MKAERKSSRKRGIYLSGLVAYALASPLLHSANALASGERCEGQCVVIDSDNDRVYVLDHVSETADVGAPNTNTNDMTVDDLMEFTQDRCKQTAVRGGYPGQAILVRAIHYSQYHEIDRSDESSGSSWGAAGRVGYAVFVAGGSSYEESHSFRKVGYMSVDPTFVTVDKDCHRDSSVRPGTLPKYAGDLPLEP